MADAMGSKQGSVFLEVDGLKGETAGDRPGQIQLFSFNWGVSMPMTNGNGTMRAAGRPVMRDVTVTKPYDITSPSLMLKCAKGEEIKSIKLHMLKLDAMGKGGKLMEYSTYTMDQVLVTSVTVDASVDPPEEVVSFNFQRITQDYNSPQGKPSATWSLKDMGK